MPAPTRTVPPGMAAILRAARKAAAAERIRPPRTRWTLTPKDAVR